MGRESGGEGCGARREGKPCAELDWETQQVAQQVALLGWWSSPDGLCTETLSPRSQRARGKREFVCLAPPHLLFPTGQSSPRGWFLPCISALQLLACPFGNFSSASFRPRREVFPAKLQGLRDARDGR